MFFKVFGRVLVGFFKGIGRGFGGLFRWIGRHEAFLGIVTVGVIAVFAVWLLLTALDINIVFGKPQAQVAPLAVAATTPEATPTPQATPTPPPVSRTNAPAATEAFMVGQINGNAQQVWDALGANLRNQLAGKGQDTTYFERLFEAGRKQGVIYET